MIARARFGLVLLLAAASLVAACRVRLERPVTQPARMVEPRLVVPVGEVADAPHASTVRLLETQSRSHIGRRLLHQRPDGEVTEDPIWLWTTTPDRYLDSALRLGIASNPDIRLVDIRGDRALAVTLVTWQLESSPGPRLVGAVEVEVTRTDRTMHSAPICPAICPPPPDACWGASPPIAWRVSRARARNTVSSRTTRCKPLSCLFCSR
jgi:hypothetical protein